MLACFGARYLCLSWFYGNHHESLLPRVLLLPKGSIVTIQDKREGSTRCKELGTGRVITVCVDSITATRMRVIKNVIKLSQVSL